MLKNRKPDEAREILLEIKNLNNLNDLKEFCRKHRELLKKILLPAAVALAVLFFWFYGSNTEPEIEMKKNNLQIEAGENIETAESDDSVDYDGTMEDVTKIYVDISGEVLNPGVYEITTGTRLFQVIEQAGGLTEDADIDHINQAEAVLDGQKIIIQNKNSMENAQGGDNNSDSGGTVGNYGQTSAYDANGKININFADETALQGIPGIGPSKAQRIIEYRNTKGKFTKIEDVKNISGIGEKTFESIKEYITV